MPAPDQVPVSAVSRRPTAVVPETLGFAVEIGPPWVVALDVPAAPSAATAPSTATSVHFDPHQDEFDARRPLLAMLRRLRVRRTWIR